MFEKYVVSETDDSVSYFLNNELVYFCSLSIFLSSYGSLDNFKKWAFKNNVFVEFVS